MRQDKILPSINQRLTSNKVNLSQQYKFVGQGRIAFSHYSGVAHKGCAVAACAHASPYTHASQHRLKRTAKIRYLGNTVLVANTEVAMIVEIHVKLILCSFSICWEKSRSRDCDEERRSYDR